MPRLQISCLISLLLLIGLITPSVFAAPQNDNQTPSVETIKSQVAKIGLGEKAKATIRLKNGAKVKGYLARAGEDDFVIRDRKTDTPTTIHFTDVAKVEANRGHSTVRNTAIGVGVGVGGAIGVILILLARG